MRKNTVRCTCIHQELPCRQLIYEMEEFAGSDGIQLPPAPPFPCHEQG